MKTYSKNSICIKCGTIGDATAEYIKSRLLRPDSEEYTNEYISRKCCVCGYQWSEKPVNANSNLVKEMSKCKMLPIYGVNDIFNKIRNNNHIDAEDVNELTIEVIHDIIGAPEFSLSIHFEDDDGSLIPKSITNLSLNDMYSIINKINTFIEYWKINRDHDENINDEI